MNNQLSQCPFCLANDLLSVPIIAETAAGFLVPAKSQPGAYLVVPRVHAESIADMPDTWMADLKQLVARVPNLDHFNISVNVGKHAGQTVKHLHFWIIPRPSGQPAAGKGLVTLINLANS